MHRVIQFQIQGPRILSLLLGISFMKNKLINIELPNNNPCTTVLGFMDNLLRFKKSLQNFAHPFCSNINSSYIYKALEHLPYPFIACNDGGLWHNIFIYPATNNVGRYSYCHAAIDRLFQFTTLIRKTL